jgi:hypothetical protein
VWLLSGFRDRGYLDLDLKIDSEGRLQPSHGGDRNIFEVMTSPLPKGTIDFSSFHVSIILYQRNPDRNHKLSNIVFPLMRNTIPAAHAYGVYISQMKRYSRACGSYQDFVIEDILTYTSKRYEPDLSLSVVSFISGSM